MNIIKVHFYNADINPISTLDITILRDQIAGSAIVNVVRLHRQGYNIIENINL